MLPTAAQIRTAELYAGALTDFHLDDPYIEVSRIALP